MQSFVVNQIKKFFNKFYYRQHPETALRYLPVVSELKKARQTASKILEVGSGSLGISPYLKRPIDGLDIDFSGPQTDLVNKIKGFANNLPFRKNCYDVVISVDTLEHLSEDLREKAVYEIVRVAQKLAFIVVPVGPVAQEQDRDLHRRWLKIFQKPNQFLAEHVNYGLPKVDEILVQIDKSLRKLNKRAKVTSRPLLNLAVRNILMKTWISKNKFSYYLYLKGYLLLLPLLQQANFGNCYRRMFVIEFHSPVNSRLEPSKFTLSGVEGDRIEKAKGKNQRGVS